MEHKKAFDFLIKKSLSMNLKELATHIKKVGPLKIKTSNMKFVDHLVKIIVGQQLSVKSAAAIWERTEKILNKSNYKKPNDSLNKKFKLAGLSRQKIKYLKSLSIAFIEKKIQPEKWQFSENEIIIEELIQIKGIGRWTAEMFLIFNLCRPDNFPVDDLKIFKSSSSNKP